MKKVNKLIKYYHLDQDKFYKKLKKYYPKLENYWIISEINLITSIMDVETDQKLIMKLFQEYESDFDIKNLHEIFEISIKKGMFELAKILHKKVPNISICKYNQWWTLCQSEDLEIIKWYCENFEIKSVDFRESLELAAKTNNIEIVKYVYKILKTTFNKKPEDYYIMEALRISAMNENKEIFNYLFMKLDYHNAVPILFDLVVKNNKDMFDWIVNNYPIKFVSYTHFDDEDYDTMFINRLREMVKN